MEKGISPISRNLFEKLIKVYPLDKKRLMKAYCDELLPEEVKDYIIPKEQKENFLGDLFELVKMMDKEQQKIIIFNIIERLEYLSLKDGKFELIKDVLEQAKEKKNFTMYLFYDTILNIKNKFFYFLCIL